VTNFLLTGGGTAGHVNPLLTVADYLREKNPSDVIFTLGTKAGLEAKLVAEAGYPLLTIEKVPFPRKIGIWALVFPFKFLAAVAQVKKYLRQHKIDIVVGFGGYVSAPAYLAARSLKVPIVIHEANALPGIANKIGNRFASAAGKAFRSAEMAHTEFVGMPLRKSIVNLVSNKNPKAAREHFGLKADSFTLLVTGGSLGARSINQTIEATRPLLKAAGIQVLHIIGGQSELSEVSESEYRRIRYVEQMELAIAASDFAVSRAGAATVSEFSAVGLPALYIPYPVGNGEQKYNLQDLLSAGGCLSVSDAEFSENYVRSTLIPMLSDTKRLQAISEAARSVGVLDGTERFVALIQEVISRR
jgi:UDP-N-acetylglucosamine--N-acetylmuramyl-(pentapeptide) pyrophosphoryl-undecaprenol N-acetylglucosamine transferase